MGIIADRTKQFFNFDKGLSEVMNYVRQGLRELRSLCYGESPHARETDPGMWGNKLPMEVYQERHGEVEKTPEFTKADDSLRQLQQQFEPPMPSPAEPHRNEREME